MGSHSRAGLDRFQREQYLRANGFKMSSTGKGSHQIWQNEDMKALAHTSGFKPTENLKNGTVWQITLCSDPAGGTWRAVVSHVEAVRDMLKQSNERTENKQLCISIRKEFNQKAKVYANWKKAVKQEMKAGVQISAAPLPYIEVAALHQQKRTFTFN